MLSDLNEIEQEINSFPVNSPEELENFRLKFISRNGLLTGLFEELKNVSREEKPVVGKRLNEVKKLAESKFNNLKAQLDDTSSKKEDIDLTLPAASYSIGREHLISQTLAEMVKIFREIGFKVTDGPELEEEFYNFDALNTPAHHPARDMQDTFYVQSTTDKDKKHVLRTHTSPVQIRTMLQNKPPLRIISPGKVFRNETVTYKNYFMFHQLEGLYVDKNVSMRDLKGVLAYFFKKFYGENTKIRFIPSFFPFTEPSGQVDISCFICGGKGCKTCKETGWLEVGGCGMVDPNVFRSVNIDPEEYTGYAFGMGMERLTMMKYGIKDIRILYQNDVRFLDQF
ncbi:MAG TPA: phenylalanine--tRNA ligase subunit alpha [Ignavibacteria bacterium]|nr:phenylalanine--tRNA ligase subunit alpha [Bacteroidota bacterium]HRE09845.1 phenylalanine--tRNA ligase subunit alpha [Ignavibacteria bacterium]HRF66464.1 phenylalanine--tRNA ligase subunit alpha [Ignavibacteria bacterium]HRJ03646.1 phenylalanine--tRNA ligase subunit alpha [Ignavibacteria bacterium]HRJ84279.1 phenylalanine--tRNA ligase subunit alpha [Ignavibacteria bacterium]